VNALIRAGRADHLHGRGHRVSPALTCRFATGRIAISGPSTSTKWFVLWHVRSTSVELKYPLTPALTWGFAECKGVLSPPGRCVIARTAALADLLVTCWSSCDWSWNARRRPQIALRGRSGAR
jgi:hypothetical protein